MGVGALVSLQPAALIAPVAYPSTRLALRQPHTCCQPAGNRDETDLKTAANQLATETKRI
eukprot:351489-Chlamydomonas_euryale.AAC.3